MGLDFKDYINKPITNSYNNKQNISLKEIAACRGESSSFFVRAISNICLFFKGKVVNDEAIAKILESEDQLNEISSQFKKVSSTPTSDVSSKTELKQLKNDIKIAKDLAKIFNETTNQPKVKEFPLNELQKIQDIVNGQIELRKYDPADLLKAHLYNQSADVKESEITKDFVDFLASKNINPSDSVALKAAYKNFIGSTAEKAQKGDPEALEKMKRYQSDKPLEFYFIAMTAGNPHAEKFAKLDISRVLTIIKGQIELRKYDPTDLLRAENYEAAAGLQNESKGIKKDFIDYLNQEAEYPNNNEDLEKAYHEFINKNVKNAASDPEYLSRMKDYSADKPMNLYFLAMQTENPLAKKWANSKIPELFVAAFEKKIIQSPKIITNEVPDIKNSATETKKLVDEFMQGIGVNATLQEYTGADGKIIMIPQQALLDIHRSPYISLNNHLVYSNADKGNYTVESYYHSVHQALGGSDSATNAVLILASQGIFTNPMIHLISSYHTLDMYPKLQQDSSTKFEYHINIEGDKVKLILKNAYNIADDSVDDLVTSMGRHIVKTEITLSLSELKSFDPATPKTNLKTIKVSDIYSPLIHDIGVISSEEILQRIFKQF